MKRIVSLIVILLVIAMLAVGAYFGLKDSGKKTDDQSAGRTNLRRTTMFH